MQFFRKIRVSKGGSKLRSCQNAQNRGCLCDLGRKLENLFMPVYVQWCSATDGRTRLHEPRMARWTPFTSIFVLLESGIIRFSYFRTPEQDNPGFVQSDSLKIERHLLISESYEKINSTTACTLCIQTDCRQQWESRNMRDSFFVQYFFTFPSHWTAMLFYRT